MLVSARFIDLVLNQRMEEAIWDACLLGALILCQRLGGNLDTWMRIHQRKVLFPYLDERMIGKFRGFRMDFWRIRRFRTRWSGCRRTRRKC